MVDGSSLTTLSGVALGGMVGGILSSPLGPWGAVGGSTLGATVGGWLTTKVWQEFYVDLRERMEQVKVLLEEERFPEAVELIGRIRAHPRYAEQQRHFRSELEEALGRITLHLARRADAEGDVDRALDWYRRVRDMRPADPALLERVIRLKTTRGEAGYESVGGLEEDLRRLLELDTCNVWAFRSLLDLYDRLGDERKAEEVLREALGALRDRPAERLPFLLLLRRRSPDDVELAVETGAALLDAERLGEATALLEEELRRGEPAAGTAAWEAVKGEILLARGDLDGAHDALRRAVEERTLLPRANLGLGRVLMLRKAWPEAAAALAPLVALPRYQRDVLAPLAECLIRGGRLREAELHVDRPLFGELPESGAVMRLLAEAYERKGLADDARRVWDRLGDRQEGPPFWRRYTVVHRGGAMVILGSGRMGRVFLGRRREDDTLVALREIPFAGLRDTVILKRFRREVEILSTLSHPNVVALLDHALLEGKCLMALEYCGRGSLRERAGQKLPWSEIKGIMLDVLEGLACLHGHAPPLVHRNLTPSNVLFGADGAARVGDLGLARLLDAASTSVVTSVQEQAQGYRYASPEVILGAAEVGPPADLYSVGCMLYEMLTGAPPFVFATVDDQIRAHLRERPAPPSSKAEWVPAELDRLVLGLLEKAPEARPPSAAAVAAGLRGI